MLSRDTVWKKCFSFSTAEEYPLLSYSSSRVGMVCSMRQNFSGWMNRFFEPVKSLQRSLESNILDVKYFQSF